MVAPLMLAVKIGSSSSHTQLINHAVREPCRIFHCMQHAYAQPIRRSVIVALALTGAAAFVAPLHPATGKALRAAAIEEEPEAPKYPTVNVIAAASDMHRYDNARRRPSRSSRVAPTPHSTSPSGCTRVRRRRAVPAATHEPPRASRRRRLSRTTARRAGRPTSRNSWRASRARCRPWATSTPRASRRASPSRS